MSAPLHEPTLADVLKSFWRARVYILIGVVTALAAAFLFLASVTPLYKGAMIVAPADGYALGDYASSVADGQSLDLPFWRPKDQEGVSTDFYRFVYTSTGASVAAILLKDQSVLTGIAKDGRWRGKGKDWSADELAEYLGRYVRIEHLGTTPLRRLSYQHPDPVFAAAFLRKIHLVADQLIRRDRRRHSESRIAYLQEALQKTVNPDHRKGITNLLMQQEHIRMLANLDEAYAAIVVEPPSATSRPAWPKTSLVLVAFTFVGMLCGYLVWSLRHAR